MEIRPYHPGDAPTLARSYNGLYEKSLTPAAFKAQIAAIMAENGRCWTITNSHNQPVGYACIEPVLNLPTLADLDGLIDPHWQRRGLGSRLLGHIGRELAGGPIRRLSHGLSDLNSPAAHFLRHHRFQISHQEYTLLLTEWDNLPPPVPPTPHCRVAPLTRREQAVALFNRLYDAGFTPHPWHQPYSRAELAATLQQTADLRFLWEGEEAIGVVWLHYPAPAAAEIEPMGIVPEKQGQGYGRYLLLDTLHLLRRQAITHLSLGLWAGNEIALSLYQSVGFRHSDTRIYFTLQL